MNAVTQFVITVLTAAALCLPSVAFVLWLVLRTKRQKKLGIPFTRRIRSAVASVIVGLGACAAVAAVSRLFEAFSANGLFVSASMVAAYAFYAFVAANLVALVLLLVLWAFSPLLKEPNRVSLPTPSEGRRG